MVEKESRLNTAYQDYLSHHGIKGMRWGVRRFQNEDGTLTEEGKRKQRNSKPESATWKSKDARTLSDDELRRRNARLQQEQQYRALTASRGERALSWIKKTAGTILVATAIASMKGRTQVGYKNLIGKYGPKLMTHLKRAGGFSGNLRQRVGSVGATLLLKTHK